MGRGEPFSADGAGLAVWRDCASLEGLRTAAIGGFWCDYEAAGAALLEATAERLAAEGFRALLGPMNGDTWASYRFVVETDGRPPFPMEPNNPPWYPTAFELAGFRVVAHYVSTVRGIDASEPALALPEGLRLRPFDPGDADDDLRAIHRVSLEAFSRNAFYAPITEERFLDMYRSVLPGMDGGLLLLAEDAAGALQGFLYGLADPDAPHTIVIKSYASLRRGLGSALVSIFHARAAERGCTSAIHALMHVDNLSTMRSGSLGAHMFRRYALWGRRL